MTNMQSARTLEKGESRLTPYFVQIQNETNASDPVYQVGGMLGAGVNDRLEWQFRVDHFTAFKPEDDGYTFISTGPKIAVVEDRVAVVFPVGMYSTSIETAQIQPGIIVTPFSSRYVEFTAAARYIFAFHQDLSKWTVFNVGLGLSSDLNKWAIMPEIGIAKDMTNSEQKLLLSYGAALVFYFNEN